MKTVTPDLIIEINVDCPHCKYFFDILRETDLNDEGEVLNMALPDSVWCDEHEKFEIKVTCPECKKEFLAKGLNW